MIRDLAAQPVYPLLDPDVCARQGRGPHEVLGAWSDLKLRVFQLRAKDRGPDEYTALAREFRAKFPDLRILANDHAEVALERQDLFAGLHVGQEDWGQLPEGVRSRIRKTGRENLARPASEIFEIGLSTHDASQLEQALSAWTGLAPQTEHPLWSYVATGPMWGTSSKTIGLSPLISERKRRDLFQKFVRVRAEIERRHPTAPAAWPFLVAIGGITDQNVGDLLADWPRMSSVPPLRPAVIQAALDFEQLTFLIKKVALQESDKTLET